MNLNRQFKIGRRWIGPGKPTFIVAEMSGNHNQNFSRALKIIDEAAKAGADAIKLQTYTPDTMTIDSHQKWFRVRINKTWKGKTLYQLYQWAYTPWEWQEKLIKYAREKSLIAFSTPFDETAVDFLEKLNVPVYKIASFELVDTPLLKKIAQTKKPVILSRGMATLAEMKLAVKTLRENGTKQLAILHCVSSYPARLEQMNLSTISDIARRFRVVAGLSDHSLGITAAITSIALGAVIIEKHLTLNRADGGPDAAFSLEPQEFTQMVRSVREAEIVIGKPCYILDKKQAENIIFRRSLFAVADIAKGKKFTLQNIRSIRPGCGLPPTYLGKIIGLRAAYQIKRGTPLNWHLIKNASKS